MICVCGSRMKCTDTREAPNSKLLQYAPTRRRHECATCGNRITTYEYEVDDFEKMKSPNSDELRKRIMAVVVNAIENTR